MAMNLKVEPPEKKKRKKKIMNSSPPYNPSSFSSLPDDIAVNCLARISSAYYPTLSIVSKSFRSILSSTDLYAARSHFGNTEQSVYVCLLDDDYKWFRLWVNPNRTRPDSSMIHKKRKKKTTGKLLAPITSSTFPYQSYSTVAFGHEIYVIGGHISGPSSAVRVLDCRSHTWRDAPSMNVARKSPSTCVYDGKIYVIGGRVVKVEDSWAEVFDTKTQTWECLPNPDLRTELRKHKIVRFVEVKGKIHFENAKKTYAYDPIQGKWECCLGRIMFPFECAMDSVSYRYDHCGLICKRNGNPGNQYVEYVKGLDSLGDMYKRNGGSRIPLGDWPNLVSCGGKLLLLWEGYQGNRMNMKKIWCAEISIEKRDGGEVWGNVECIDVVHRVPSSCQLLQCLVVSV